MVILNMKGVTNMTDSFANACFTSLFVHLNNELEGKIVFKECTPLLQSCLRDALSRANLLLEDKRSDLASSR